MAAFPITPNFGMGSHPAAYPGSGFPFGGSMQYKGHTADSRYDPMGDYFEINYLQNCYRFSSQHLLVRPTDAINFLDNTFHQFFTNPYNTGGLQNVPWQSPQVPSGNSAVPQVGPAGTVTSVTITNARSSYSGPPAGSLQGQLAAVTRRAFAPSAFQQQVLSNLYPEIESKPEPLKEGGIKLGELVGWRGWNIDSHGFLHSMSADVLWAPGEPMEGDVKAAKEHNGCYAYKHLRDLLKNHSGGLGVYGQVHMWGRVIEHQLGYRSEWAKIISLDGVMPPAKKAVLTALRERYGLVS